MNPNTYQSLAMRTDSPITEDIRGRLRDTIHTLKILITGVQSPLADLTKKHIFYGKLTSSIHKYSPEDDIVATYMSVAGIRRVHAFLGLLSEMTELAEIIEGTLSPKDLDRVHVKEECGDLLWYIALMLDATGITMEEAMESNIKKLQARFPDRFSEESALNRNLKVEREALEEALEPPCGGHVPKLNGSSSAYSGYTGVEDSRGIPEIDKNR